MEYRLTINPEMTILIESIGLEKHPVIIVDDFLSHPTDLVQYAAREVEFGTPSTPYPGLSAPLPDGYVASLAEGLGDVLADVFRLSLSAGSVRLAYFALATSRTSELTNYQTIPHADCEVPTQLAILHYLCSSNHGGTSFFRQRSTGFESLDAAKKRVLIAEVDQYFADHPEHPKVYYHPNHPLFEEIATFEARFNRLIVYRGNSLHAPRIVSDQDLSGDVFTGRLTVNTFVQFQSLDSQ